MRLTATAVKQAKPQDKPYKLTDGKGMYLKVMPNGSKYWRMNYRFAERAKTLALGTYPDTTLAEARDRRDIARKELANDIDPAESKKARKSSLRDEALNSFKAVGIEWFNTKMKDRSQSHRDRTMRALEKDIFPSLGHRPIAQISAPEVLKVLRKIEARGAVETAHRAKQTAGQIFRYAIATGRAERDPSADLKGALANPVKRHLAAITNPKDVGQLLVAMDGYMGTPVVKTALLLSPLVFCRPGELRRGEWSEINWEEACWDITAERMKIGKPHIIPISRQALK